MNTTKPEWQILLISGSSGVGKSHLARQLSEHYKTPLTEMDDIRIALQQLVSREQHPELFTLYDNPDYRIELNEREFSKQQLAVAEVVWKALDPLLSKHIRLQERVIFEGDCIVPDLLKTRDLEQIKAIFIYDDLEEIKNRQRLRNRPGNPIEHSETDALFAYTHGMTLKEQAETNDFVAIHASPLETLFERVITALEQD
jgi:2-phosphoglycerate kinase